jgi:flagellar basal-body rod protein FlgB
MADASSPDLNTLLVQRMAYLNQRQAILAENVANTDTPGYKARDLAPFTFGDALKQASIGMAVTDPHHILPASMAGVNTKTIKSDSIETLPNGNNVDMEQQMMEVSKTAVDYQGITSIYRSIGELFNLAIKGTKT